MTTFAMVIGVVPLAFATGAGAEGRIQIRLGYSWRYVAWDRVYVVLCPGYVQIFVKIISPFENIKGY